MLATLSTELVEHISAFLDGPHLSSLRLVCRSLRAKTTAVFGRAWLGLVETDLSEKSLRRLEAIAGHDVFRHSTCTLRIVRVSGDDDKYTCVYGPLDEGYWNPPRPPSPRDFSSVAVVWNFQDMLRRLANCNAFEVCDQAGCFPDGNGVAVGLAPTNVLYLVLSAMATDSRPVQTLRISFPRPDGYRLAEQLPSIAIHSDVFPSLQDLRISWTIGDEVIELALSLITAAPRLKRLSLGFETYGDGGRFWRRLAAVPTLPPIADLRLGSAHDVPYTALVSVILRLQGSLRSLHIGHLGLHDGDWDSLFGDMSRHDFPCLERVALCFLRAPQPPGLSHQGDVYFCPLRLKQKALEKCGGCWEFALRPQRKKMRIGAVRFTGPRTGIRLALEALADDSHYLICRGTRSPSPGLPNMKNFTGDGVGRVVPRFDLVKTWDGQMSS